MFEDRGMPFAEALAEVLEERFEDVKEASILRMEPPTARP